MLPIAPTVPHIEPDTQDPAEDPQAVDTQNLRADDTGHLHTKPGSEMVIGTWKEQPTESRLRDNGKVTDRFRQKHVEQVAPDTI